jgi:hypothetical protein
MRGGLIGHSALHWVDCLAPASMLAPLTFSWPWIISCVDALTMHLRGSGACLTAVEGSSLYTSASRIRTPNRNCAAIVATLALQ